MLRLTAESGSATDPKPNPEILQEIAVLARDYRSRIPAIVEEHPFPHELPLLAEVLHANLGQNPGEKKRALVVAFQPLGFRIRGGSGIFTLRWRSPTNLTVELTIDVGTWSNLVSARYAVLGPGFSASVPLPAAASSLGAPHYPSATSLSGGRSLRTLPSSLKLSMPPSCPPSKPSRARPRSGSNPRNSSKRGVRRRGSAISAEKSLPILRLYKLSNEIAVTGGFKKDRGTVFSLHGVNPQVTTHTNYLYPDIGTHLTVQFRDEAVIAKQAAEIAGRGGDEGTNLFCSVQPMQLGLKHAAVFIGSEDNPRLPRGQVGFGAGGVV